MRCQCCNDGLTDQEATRKDSNTGEYLDTCNICLGDEFLMLEAAVEQATKVTDRLASIQESSKL